MTSFSARIGGGILFAFSAITASGSDAGTAGEKRPFTVVDAIELRQLARIAWEDLPHVGRALFSPSGQYFVVRTKQGHLATDTVSDELVLFRATEVERYVNVGDVPALTARVIVRSAVTRPSRQLSAIQWINDRLIGYVAADDTDVKQAFEADVVTGHMRQLTRHRTDVTAFSVAGKRVFYEARIEEPAPQTVIAHERWLGDMLELRTDREYRYPTVEWFMDEIGAGKPVRLNVAPSKMRSQHLRLSASPSGRYLVTVVPATNALPHWAEYQLYHQYNYGYTPDRASPDPKSVQLQARTRYQLIDTVTGKSRPLLDAPTGYLTLNYSPQVFLWPPDRNSVIVTNAFLPLPGVGKKERALRASAPAVAEIDLDNGAISVVAREPNTHSAKRPGAGHDIILSVDWGDGHRTIEITTRLAQGGLRMDSYERSGNRWRLAESRPRTNPLEIAIREDMHTRPVLVARSEKCGCEKVLLDPSAALDGFKLGRAELRRWTDGNDTQWEGSLIYPPDFVAGRHYPLVVQTHGFSPHEFLIGGPKSGTTGMAAQPLASSGFLVLQVGDLAGVTSNTLDGARRYAEGYRAGIAELIESGLADPERIGIVAFSATGIPTMHLLAMEPNLLAAVVLSDASLTGYVTYIQQVNAAPDYHAQWMQILGLTPGRYSFEEIMADSPIYPYARQESRSAVRMEALRASSAIAMWETYALLRYAGQPVDFVYQHDAQHSLFRPSQRLVSQGGTVDWMRFWLQGVADPDPSKAAQYERWRELRGTASASAAPHATRSEGTSTE